MTGFYEVFLALMLLAAMICVLWPTMACAYVWVDVRAGWRFRAGWWKVQAQIAAVGILAWAYIIGLVLLETT